MIIATIRGLMVQAWVNALASTDRIVAPKPETKQALSQTDIMPKRGILKYLQSFLSYYHVNFYVLQHASFVNFIVSAIFLSVKFINYSVFFKVFFLVN